MRGSPWADQPPPYRTFSSNLFLCALLLSATPVARAGDVCPPDPAAHVDSVEHWNGATNVNGVVGNGGLSVGVSNWGEVSVLRWPSPSSYSHLTYLTLQGWPNYVCGTRMPATAPGTWGELRRPVVVAPNMGVFSGLYVFAPTLPSGILVWLQDPSWRIDQSYRSPDSAVLVTRFLHPSLGLRVTQWDLVLPDRDVLARHHRVEVLRGSPVTAARFLDYENLGPTLTRGAGNPVLQNNDGGDFAALYSAAHDALVHFTLPNRPYALLDPLMNGASPSPSRVDGFLSGLAGPGVFFALGGDRPSAGHQVGEDDFLPCGVETGWSRSPRGAFSDAAATAGTLSGDSAAGCQTDGALSFPLSLDALSSWEITTYLAAASTPSGALALLEEARGRTWDAHLEATDRAWGDWIGRARLPDAEDPAVERFSKRALISIREGQDRETSAIVASLSMQPNYGADWSRDGAYLNLALDLAGYHERVTPHDLFYARVQRLAPSLGGPAGSWASNFYADGTVAMALPSFEIDETGLALWTMVTHAKFLDDPCERASYLEAIYPSVRRGADLLVRCKDPATGLQCLASEDDNPVPSVTLHGAASTLLGIESAVEAGKAMGESRALLASWKARADEIRGIIVSAYDPTAGHFVKYVSEGTTPNGLVCATCKGRGPYWILWPARVLPPSDPRMQAQADYLFTTDVGPALRKETDGFGYLNEVALALTRTWAGRSDRAELVREMVRSFFHDVPTPGTDHLGEVEVVVDLDGDGIPEFQNRVAMPHLWKQSINYLLALAAYDPEAFDRVEAPLQRPVCLESRGWGCSALSGGRAGGETLVLVGLLLVLGISRGGRRSPRSRGPS